MDAASYGERAKALARQGRHQEAEEVLRAGLAALPQHPILSYALAVTLLSRGEFTEGWPLYENRRFMPFGPPSPRFSFPEWRGQPVESLLVLPEQGLGDQLMFARWIPELVRRGVRVTLAVHPSLARLYSELGVTVVAVDGTITVPAHEAWCFIGSLPALLGCLPEAAFLRSHHSAAGIGIMVAGSARPPDRSLPPHLAEIVKSWGRSLDPRETRARDFRETADIIDALAIVITVDTSVANLAGSMGKTTWVMLPEPADWRWGRSGMTSALYPSAKLFRQPAPGHWEAVLAAVEDQLARRVSTTSAKPPEPAPELFPGPIEAPPPAP